MMNFIALYRGPTVSEARPDPVGGARLQQMMPIPVP